MPRLRVDKGYEKAARNLSPADRERASRTLLRFMDDPTHPSLNFEALKGRAGYFSIRATLSIRVLLREESDEGGVLYVAIDVGSHQIYRRR